MATYPSPTSISTAIIGTKGDFVMFKYINIRNSVAAVAALAGAACVYKAFTAKTAKAKALWAVAALLLLGGGGWGYSRRGR